jgi:pectate lyase
MIKPLFSRGLILFLGFHQVCHATAQLPAFPGAAGFGAQAVGGRFGDVYHVTSLSADAKAPGSLAYGLATVPEAGRTIVFEVSGYIPVNGRLALNHPKVTIAGQTAPGDGIGLQGGTFLIAASDVVIRHVRFRNGRSADTINLDARATNCIIDHCDVLLGKDENLSSFRRPADNFTFSWSINAWGLETHSAGGLWDFYRATCHHSLWAHNHTRNPKARPARLDWINNITFDYDIGFILGDSASTADWKANIIGSWFISPPGNLRPYALEKARLQATNNQPNFSLHIADSALDANGDGGLNASKSGYAIASGDYHTNATPFTAEKIPVTRDDSLTAYKKVLSAVGPLRLAADPARPVRDELDTILVNNVVKQLRHHVHSAKETGASNDGYGKLDSTPAPADTDRDGLPDFWENALGSNPNADDHTNPVPATAFVPTGYTLLEEYLHFLATPHAVASAATAPAEIDLRKYVYGFTLKPPATFALGRVQNGEATVTAEGVARFTPTANQASRAQFDFTVTDSDGSQWTQTFLVLVTPGNPARSK